MASEEEQRPLVHRSGPSASHWSQLKKSTMALRGLMAFSVLLVLAGGTWFLQQRQRSTIDTGPLEGYCAHIKPIQPDEYLGRHARLAKALKEEQADALIMEGGASMIYYANIHWELTERPFMTVLQRDSNASTGIRMTIVTPAFEATRAQESLKQAHLHKDIQVNLVEWLEHGSPFEAVQSIFQNKSKVLVEQDARLFIYQGMKDLALDVQMAPQSIRRLRMIKSAAELDIMRCANTVTEMAIRTVRPHIQVGMTEFDIQRLMERTLHKAGLTNTWVLALVDENAALPHGSSSQKKVTKQSTVLIDTGGELLGYQSDTTRTFFMGNRGQNQTIEDAWYLVRRAQENVLNRVNKGMSCAQVDLTARDIIKAGGYGDYFTHRLGHGIGLLMHEDPYMNQGNHDQFLAPGMTFSVEPGIYVTNEFGIRLEDIVVVNEDGQLELLTHGLAQNPWTL